MKIGTKLILSSSAAVLLTLLVLSVFLAVSQNANRTREAVHFANSIHRSVSELNILTHEYLLYREKRMEAQWFMKYNAIFSLLQNEKQVQQSASAADFLKGIRASHENFGRLFSKVVESDEKKRQSVHAAPRKTNREFDSLEERLIGRMLISSQEMITKAARFDDVVLEEMEKTEEMEFLIVGGVMILYALLMTIILLFLRKGILKPLSQLIESTQIIGGGNLDHAVAVASHDEIGELAQSFNSMTQRLKETTSSRDDLNKEIEERKKAESAARKSKDEWEKTFDAMSDIVTIQDRNMRIVRANKAAYDAFQLEPGALNGRYCYELFRDEGRPCQNCPVVLTMQETATQSANITHDRLGKIFHVTSSPILDEGGGFTHVVHVAKDITAHKKMEAELFQAHKMEAIGTLAGGIAHDFNNILAAILGYADMAKDDMPAWSPSRNYIDQVLQAGNRAKELVKQILTFSRKGQEIQQPIQPALVIKEAIKLMRASLPTTIEIQEEIHADCGYIVANPTNIHQVLVNLCTNALHAMENEKGVLAVTLRRLVLQEADIASGADTAPGMFVELVVRDTGIGMDKATVDRIFEPYFTTKEVGKGSGMGLALVRGIVHGCGGFIKVESEPHKGTTFHLYFPAVPDEAVQIEEELREPLPGGNERIMIVDDEELIGNMYGAILKKLGYEVTVHCSSLQVLEAFQAAPENFDLLLTDQTMPNLTGAELAKKILQIRPDMPIILCTGYSSMISEEKALAVGIERFLLKPLNKRGLATTVREVLDSRKAAAR